MILKYFPNFIPCPNFIIDNRWMRFVIFRLMSVLCILFCNTKIYTDTTYNFAWFHHGRLYVFRSSNRILQNILKKMLYCAPSTFITLRFGYRFQSIFQRKSRFSQCTNDGICVFAGQQMSVNAKQRQPKFQISKHQPKVHGKSRMVYKVKQMGEWNRK